MLGCALGKLYIIVLMRILWTYVVKSLDLLKYTSFRWALVKDEDVARKMTKYIEINTIGVSKDSQVRAAKVLKLISDNSEGPNEGDSFFEFSYRVMANRWKQLREAVQQSGLFSVSDFPPHLCMFLNRVFEPQPGKRKCIHLIPQVLWTNLNSLLCSIRMD